MNGLLLVSRSVLGLAGVSEFSRADSREVKPPTAFGPFYRGPVPFLLLLYAVMLVRGLPRMLVHHVGTLQPQEL